MYQTSSNTFRSQQHILAAWGEQCGGYINQLSKYSMSVSLCLCVCCRHWRVQRQAMPQQRVVCTRHWQFHLCVWAGLHWCPVRDRWAGFFMSWGKVGIAPQRKDFLLLSASNFWQMFLSKEFPSLPRQIGYGWIDLQTKNRVTHCSNEPRWESSLQSVFVSNKLLF